MIFFFLLFVRALYRLLRYVIAARCGGYWAPGVDSRDSADDTIICYRIVIKLGRKKLGTNHTSYTHCTVIHRTKKITIKTPFGKILTLPFKTQNNEKIHGAPSFVSK